MFQVSADIRYLDGALAGLTIPAGFRVTVGSIAEAVRTTRWLEGVRADGDFVRASGTGNRYEVVGGVRADVIS